MARSTSKSFTLIELLIVVAIIAILAAIAVPNFLEAQVRAKVSRVHSDLRTLDLGLSSYFTDHNKFPLDFWGIWLLTGDGEQRNFQVNYALWVLTTPVAFITSVNLQDPFQNATSAAQPVVAFDRMWAYIYSDLSHQGSGGDIMSFGDWWTGALAAERSTSAAVVLSVGPDRHWSQGEWAFCTTFIRDVSPLNDSGTSYIYDGTNGTVSDGDVVRGVGGFSGRQPAG